MMTVSECLYKIGEPYAAGLFSCEDRALFYRHCAAQAEWFDAQIPVAYGGESLYPCGAAYLWSDCAVPPHYAKTYEYNDARLAQKLSEADLSTEDADAALCAQLYHDHLSRVHDFLPGAWEAVQNLHRKYRLFLASNGTAHVQAQRLRDTGLQQYFEDIFISEELGADKPSREFFARSFARIPDFDPSRAMIVGDSLTSDILGGKNAGIATCWVNPHGKKAPEDIQPDYEISSIAELEALLRNIN